MKNNRFVMRLFFYAISLTLMLFVSARAEISFNLRPDMTVSGRGEEYVIDLSDDWRFGGMGEEAYVTDFDDSDWDAVNLPHTWNAIDGADGDGYERAPYWYRKEINIDSRSENKRVFLEFLGANQETDLFVNGTHLKMSGSDLYTHLGGYTAFRYDLTDALQTGKNILAVRVSNAPSERIAPISGDFNIYGGIYRRVFLITADEVHVDLSNNGSSGLFLTTPNIRSKERPEDLGTLNIRADIVNDGMKEKSITVRIHIDGDNAPADLSREITIPAGEKVRFDETVFIQDPHLWQGIDYSGLKDDLDVGYRYTVTLTLLDGNKAVDTVSEKVGFRYFYADQETGFYLNGESYPLHGVNRHQFKENLGNALMESDHEEDLALIMEMGTNAIRLCHYPHADYFYELCDQKGIIVWTEIPLVDRLGAWKGFLDTTQSQLRELIRQQYNRPSVCFWGLENELDSSGGNPYYGINTVLTALDDLAHVEDNSGRYTTQAVSTDAARGWQSDLIAWNIYPGWYKNFQGSFEEIVQSKMKDDGRPVALSEYGWGASTIQHELYPELGKNGLSSDGLWHPEEYQSMMHEQAIAYINAHEDLWATFLWCMFDFDVDARDEGSRIAQNDKGLVTNDRQTRKDSFYLYKANWNRTEPFVHITSSRYTGRNDENTYVKVYSNCDSVQLYINDSLIGDMVSTGNGVFILEGMKLVDGKNTIRASGKYAEALCEDVCVWRYPASSSTELMVAENALDAVSVNNALSSVALAREMTLGELRAALIGVEKATYRVMQGKREITDENARIRYDMTVLVTAENGINTHEYSISSSIPVVLASGITVSSTSNERGNTPDKALDKNSETFWAAVNNTYPQSIMLDLGEIRKLDTIEIDWSTKRDRHYSYIVEVSRDGQNFVTAVDRQNNETPGIILDTLNGTLARYVRITVLSCSDNAGYAVIYEIRVNGE